MRTLYIDVYFLINFTVDIISMYFASRFSKVPSSTKRLILSSFVGAIIAVLTVLFADGVVLKSVCAAVGLLLMGLITPKKVAAKRRIKFLLSFLIFQAMVGGGVSFIFGILDRYIWGYFEESGGAVNRKMLLFALIILLVIGVFKMLVSFFSNIESEGSVDVEISFLNKSTKVTAFVDSGNLAKDPMDMTPVLFLKKDIAKTILPENIVELSNIDSLDRSIKKRIRLIPVSRGDQTHVMVGVKADNVKILNKNKTEDISVTIAIDKEGGDFGGYMALMPSAALDNVHR